MLGELVFEATRERMVEREERKSMQMKGLNITTMSEFKALSSHRKQRINMGEFNDINEPKLKVLYTSQSVPKVV